MSIFKAYDIRGIYGRELTDVIAEKIGFALIKYTKTKNIVVGYDSRNSSINLLNAFSKGAVKAGAKITNIGLVSKPMLNWVAIRFRYDLGVMITASHNPKEYNGFNFMKGRNVLHYNNGLKEIEKIVNRLNFDNLKNKDKNLKKDLEKKVIKKNYLNQYIAFLSKKINRNNLKKLKVVGDASNGGDGKILELLMKKNNINCKLIFTEPNGDFPNHDPNPLKDEAFGALRKKVLENKADFGFMVDPDADRVRFVDEKGNILDNSYVQALIIRYLLQKHKKSFIVREITSRIIVSETIKSFNGTEIISKVGHPNIIDNMNKHKAIYGCESSGHNFFRDFYNLDSGIFMIITFINMYLSQNKKVSELINELKKYNFLEKNYNIEKDYKKILHLIKKHFLLNKKKYEIKEINNIDGLTIISKNFWFNIRSSNTEPLMRFKIESESLFILKKITYHIENIIKKPDI
ncbi:MAG: phosphomannomutase/phosphoglucomutase [Candidatus Woesearchaeota archaeon]